MLLEHGQFKVLGDLAIVNQHGLKIVGPVPFPGATHSFPGIVKFGDLRQQIGSNVADGVVVCAPPRAPLAQVESVLRTCDEAGIPFGYVGDPSGREPHGATSSYGEMSMVYPVAPPHSLMKFGTKRAIDMLLATVLIALLLLPLVLIALAVKLLDRGPVFHRQVRVGVNGRHFTMLKFRTMVVGAEAMRASLEHLNEEDGPTFKIKRDPRITKIGAFLRKHSLDELPQLFNVLRGDMSLVGPRPPVPEEVRQYESWQRRRIAMRPGLTCIWQVFGRNKVTFQRWMEMDIYYIDHWSPWMDLKLICQTVGVVLRGTGS